MAKKKKKRVSSRRRRRRIGALGKTNLNEVLTDGLGLAAGAFSKNMVSKGVEKIMPNANTKIKAAMPLVVGSAAMLYGGKNKFIKNAGAGLFAASVSDVLKEFGIGQAPVADDVDKLMQQLDEAQRAAEEDDTEDADAVDVTGAPLAGTNDVGLPD